MEVSLTQPELTAKEDTDGEMRIFHLEGVLEFEIRLYGTEEAEILEDVYSPEKDLDRHCLQVFECIILFLNCPDALLCLHTRH